MPSNFSSLTHESRLQTLFCRHSYGNENSLGIGSAASDIKFVSYYIQVSSQLSSALLCTVLPSFWLRTFSCCKTHQPTSLPTNNTQPRIITTHLSPISHARKNSVLANQNLWRCTSSFSHISSWTNVVTEIFQGPADHPRATKICMENKETETAFSILMGRHQIRHDMG